MKTGNKLALILICGLVLFLSAGCAKKDNQDHTNMPNMDHSNMNTDGQKK
jgi:hypothetical protein